MIRICVSYAYDVLVFFFCYLSLIAKYHMYKKAAAVVNSGLLLMAVMGLTFPAVLHFTHSEVQYGKSEVSLSRFSSCVMLVAYASYLVFQLKSHKNLYSPADEVNTSINLKTLVIFFSLACH